MIKTSLRNGVQVLKFNNPKLKNALDSNDYKQLTHLLTSSASDSHVRLTVLTGEGDFYSSGNNIKKIFQEKLKMSRQQYEEDTKKFIETYRNLMVSFIDYPKLLVALVNGPCVGITAVTAALCDLVWCSDSAYFYTPFSKLALCAEGCSSYTFPRIMGTSMATQMLMLNHKMSAKEARDFHFVSRVYGSSEVEGIWGELEEIAKLPEDSLRETKRLIRRFDRDELLKANERELDLMYRRAVSEEAWRAIEDFARKSQAKTS